MPIQAGFGSGSFRTYGLATKPKRVERPGAVEYLVVGGGGGGG